jgi:hypothetical protein
VATRLPYYTGEDDIYSQLMRQFQTELPYYSAPVAGVTGGYNPMLYSMPPGLGYNAGLLGDTGLFAGAADSASDGGLIGSSPTSGGFGGFGGFGSSGVSANGSVSTGFGGLSLSPEGVVSPNSLSVPNSIALGLAGLVTGLPLGLIGMIGNQSAAQAAQALSQSLSDTMGVNAPDGITATAGPSGTGGAAASAASAAAAAASAAGLSDAAIGAASQAAANAAISGASPSEAAAIGAAAAGQAGMASEGISGDSAAAIADASSAGTAADAPSAIGGDGGGGPGGGKIICTKLHELGKMPTEIYEADQAFGAMLVNESPETYQGYACWAQHVVRWMGRDDLFGKFVVFAAYHIATPWSKAMAQEMGVKVESGWFGRFLMKQGLKVCRAIAKMNQDRSVQNV